MRHAVLGAGIAALLAFASAAQPASADEPAWRAEANAFDLHRLDDELVAFEKAVTVARAGGGPDALKQLTAAIGLPPQPIDAEMLPGDWRCHTIKMGGPFLPIVAYRWFDCRIVRDAEGLRLEKLNGSQRVNGRLYPDGPERMILLGAGSLGDEAFVTQYSGPSGALGASPDNRDEPGVLRQRDRGLLTIGFPWPVVESNYDLLVLKR